MLMDPNFRIEQLLDGALLWLPTFLEREDLFDGLGNTTVTKSLPRTELDP
eukprot:CAMPEP_0169288072 /NCGR_PEP_ID=MMETSP1016-20121227/60332_1 /TAXON_ID=342587 /ORGANISM="Karlodinium micrum, Strain CCMP2283" /LENGTH=49 /DNA_ID= /DNA_START= /DNA_END= /DNA_ORIENTATION=